MTNFLLFKYAINDSSLYDWSPNYDTEKANLTGHAEYGSLYQKLFQLMHKKVGNNHINVRAILWAQGEKDAKVTVAGNQYYSNFNLFIQSIRKDFRNDELPVLFAKVSPPENKFPAADTVIRSQIKIDTVVNHTYLINTDRIDKSTDNIHYSSQGQLELGKRFGKKLVEILHEYVHE